MKNDFLKTIPESLTSIPFDFDLHLEGNPIESFPTACKDESLPTFKSFLIAWIDMIAWIDILPS